MPRGVKKKRGGRAAAVDEVDTVSGELDGEPAPEPSNLGAAIESVREALAPFDKATRKRIVRAAAVVLE